jgi:S-sulfo-L-cysteine synthase (O-acetyl-L-serine-dependent)
MIYKNILETIGHTPMVKINKLNPNPKVEIYAKLEGVNPGGSIKDRIALKMVEQAEKEGILTKRKTIIEPTSGNTGIGLAMIGAMKGYQVEIVMSSAVSVERQKTIRAFGAKITLTDGKLGTDGAIKKARELVKKNPSKYFMPDQFSNKYNKMAHYETTAKEIWKDTNGKIDYFVSTIGTSGTLMGIARYLKKYNPKIKIICAYPVKGHYIQGLKNMGEAIVPAIYDEKEIDEFINIGSEEAFAMARKIVKYEGIFVGMSSGAAMLAAYKLAKKISASSQRRTKQGGSASGGKYKKIVTIFPDRGEKYLSTKLFK